MLCLSRKLDEEIIIGSNITIKILKIHWDQKRVVIGIDAPDNIRVVRGELDDRNTEQS